MNTTVSEYYQHHIQSLFSVDHWKTAPINTGNILMKAYLFIAYAAATLPFSVVAEQNHHHSVTDNVIKEQRIALEKNTSDKGFGPQSPRDIDHLNGSNQQLFTKAPAYTEMNLCNIHFHKNAEHKGGEFTEYAGNGDGEGNNSGYKFSGSLTESELLPTKTEIGKNAHGHLVSGDTIEVHYVYSTAKVNPGPTLGACLASPTKNPQLRVETQVFVLVNDKQALNFVQLTEDAKSGNYQQALNIPTNTGDPIEYLGSTTGPGYNEIGSPFQVTWSVRPNVLKVDINTVGTWLQSNVYQEDHAHGVRNLVINPKLLSDVQ